MRSLPVALLGLLCTGVGSAVAGPLPDVVIDDTHVYPESMSAAKDGRLFIGSIKGIVFRAQPGSAKAEPWIKPTPENGLLSLLGVLTDERSGTLWVCSSPNPFRNPPALGTASLVAFDLRTGAKKNIYPFPPPASACNDITVAHDGTVYVSDTPNGRIFALTSNAPALELFAQDEQLKGIDGLVLSGDDTMYVNIVTRGLLLRIDRTASGGAGKITQLTTSAPLAAPDGFRLIHDRTFLLAEGNGGRIDEVTINGDQARIKVLREGLMAPPAVTLVGRTAYALEGKIGYLVDPKLKGQDPGVFKAYAVPLASAHDKDSAHIAPLEAKVAALAAEAGRIEDANAVKKLQRAFGYYIDKGFWDEAADLFAADATFETGVDGVYVGKAHIRELLIRQGGGHPGPGLPYGQFNHHMQLQPVVHIEADGRTAKGRWRELALLGQFQKSAEWGDGIYENEYVKDNGVWKIQKLHYYPNFVAPYKGGWVTLKPVSGDWKSDTAKSFPADRPPTVTYEPYPNVYTPPFHYKDPVTPHAAADEARPASASSTDVARLAATVKAYEGELAILRSREAIQNLQAAYGYYFDKGHWRQVAGLFSAQGTFEFGQRGVYVGRAHILQALPALFGREGLEPGQLNNYMMLQPIIDIAPDNRTAKARWRSDVEVASGGKGQWGEGEYENEYVNDHGVWRISKLHYYVTVMADYDKGWHEAPFPMDGPSKDVPPDRPPTEVYASLPEVYLPAYHYKNPVTGGDPPVSHATPEPLSSDAPPRLAEAFAQVQELGRRIGLLQDHDAIEKVQRAYGYYVDKAEWPDVADLYQEHGTLEIGGRGIFLGKKRALEYLVTGLGPIGPHEGVIINHQQFQGIVDVAPDGNTGKGRWTAFVMGVGGWGDCYYENEYVKENGIWKIKKLQASFNMYTSYKDGWAFSATPNTRPDSFLPPPDLPPSRIYLTYPSFYVEPFHYPNPVTGRPMPRINPAAGGAAPLEQYAAH